MFKSDAIIGIGFGLLLVAVIVAALPIVKFNPCNDMLFHAQECRDNR